MTALIIITREGIAVFTVPSLADCHALAGPLLFMGRAFCMPMGLGV